MTNPRIVSSKDISKTVKNGGKVIRVKTGDKAHTNTEPGLTECLKQIVENNQMHARMHQEKMDVICRHISNLPVEDSIGPSAVAEIIEAISRVREAPRPDYEFNIQRDGRNLMTSVVVTTKRHKPSLLT